jgi:hypothetical protein
MDTAIRDYPADDLRVPDVGQNRAPGRLTLARPVQRLCWADNLRVLVMAAVVVFHTATAYLGGTT